MGGKARSLAQRQAAIIEKIILLYGWQLEDFKPIELPAGIIWFIHQADLSQLRHMLVCVLIAIDRHQNG